VGRFSDYNAGDMISAGLTNVGSDDWGNIASTQKTMMTYALCCGLTHTLQSVDSCHRCKLALFWRRDTRAAAESTIEHYYSKWTKMMEEKAAKRRADAEKAAKKLKLDEKQTLAMVEGINAKNKYKR
jgi:hypothetical protein